MEPILYQLFQNYQNYYEKIQATALYVNKFSQNYKENPFDPSLTEWWHVAIAVILPIIISGYALYLDKKSEKEKNDDDIFYF